MNVEIGQTWADVRNGLTVRTLRVVTLQNQHPNQQRAYCSIGATGKHTYIKAARLLRERRFQLVRDADGKRIKAEES